MATAETKRNDLLIRSIIGGTVGALLVLLTAPRTGRELREELMNKLQTIQSKGQKWVGQAKNKATATIHMAAEQSSELLDKAHRVTDDTATAVRQATDTAAEAVHKATDKTAQLVEKATDRVANTAHETIEHAK